MYFIVINGSQHAFQNVQFISHPNEFFGELVKSLNVLEDFKASLLSMRSCPNSVPTLTMIPAEGGRSNEPRVAQLPLIAEHHLSDITCIRSIYPDWCFSCCVFVQICPFKVLPFRCVILKYPCLHVTPQHLFNRFYLQSCVRV
jgi:hypothetical protein